MKAGTITGLDAFLADIQVVAANTGAGAENNGHGQTAAQDTKLNAGISCNGCAQ